MRFELRFSKVKRIARAHLDLIPENTALERGIEQRGIVGHGGSVLFPPKVSANIMAQDNMLAEIRQKTPKAGCEAKIPEADNMPFMRPFINTIKVMIPTDDFDSRFFCALIR